MKDLIIIGDLKSTLLDKYPELRDYMGDKGFSKWYDDKFLKYDGLADYEDQRVLMESIEYLKNKSAP